MRFAKVIFLIAGIYGLVVVLPQYFLEEKTGRDFPPPITHPEYYYGFVGVVVAWQVLFILLSRDPARYRVLMIPAVLEKATFAIAVIVLFLQERVSPVMLGFGIIDLILGALFAVAYAKTPDER
ncbi:MAG TPA: hypothetical protein VKA70_08490 [Blastocatellia bacterium]|nr:hypothetical protein [Blastocatellia bacterium]